MKKERNNMNQNFEEIKEKFNAADIDEKKYKFILQYKV